MLGAVNQLIGETEFEERAVTIALGTPLLGLTKAPLVFPCSDAMSKRQTVGHSDSLYQGC